jgi:hypothetical protein
MNNMELTHAIQEGKLLLAQKLLRDNLYDQAIESLQTLKCPEASFEQGTVIIFYTTLKILINVSWNLLKYFYDSALTTLSIIINELFSFFMFYFYLQFIKFLK